MTMPKFQKAAPKSETEMARDEEELRADDLRDDSGKLLVVARRPFEYMNEELDRGQVFGIVVNYREDDERARFLASRSEQLLRLGYVYKLKSHHQKPSPCRVCNKLFAGLDTLNGHGDKRHKDKHVPLPVGDHPRGNTVDDTAEQVEAFEREEKLLDTIAPLNFDKTKATREA
jgi:hypothetical protein